MNTPPVVIARQITAVAEHLTQHKPTERMTAAARMAVALKAAGSATAVQAVLRALPFPASGISRGEYALHARRIAWSLGWDEAA